MELYYRRIVDGGYPIAKHQILALFPNTGFAPDQTDFTEFGYDLVYETVPPEHNKYIQSVDNWQVIDKPFTQTMMTDEKNKLKQNLLDYRRTKEVGGFTLPNGIYIGTDYVDQAKLNQAFVTMQAGMLTHIDFKAADGNWIELALTDVTGLAFAVAQHVQGCFSKEKVIQQLINNISTVQELEQFNIETEWNK